MHCDGWVARRTVVPFGDEKHYVWKVERETSWPSELSGVTTKSE